MHVYLHLLSTCLALWCPVVQMYPTGAPSSACQTTHPDHGVPAQNSTSPYSIIVSETFYTPGADALTVSIEGGDFRGFLLYGQRADWRLTQGEPIGTFSTTANVQTLCEGTYGDIATHTSSTDKPSISITWTPPADGEGHVEFRATVVQSQDVYWEDVYSKRISDSTARESVFLIPQSTTPRSTQTSDLGEISTDGCGSEKGCLAVPKGCSGSGCEMIATWTPTLDPDDLSYVQIDLMGKTRGWLALGLSEDKSMGADSVMECVMDEDWVNVGHSYNDDSKGVTRKISPYTTGIFDVHASYEDGMLRCSFKRLITVDHAEVFDITQPYYLFLAIGDAVNGVKFQHAELPAVSTKKVALSSDTDMVSGAGLQSALVKAHGIFMVTAWTLLVCPAVLLAQHFKDAWPGKKLCDKKLVWLSVHRVIQICVVILTVLAFVMIFAEVRGYSQGSSSAARAHPVLGIIVTLLALTNMIMGMLRPVTTNPKRFWFNWIHWIVGCLAMLLAVINLFLGFTLRKSVLIIAGWVKYMIPLIALLYLGVQVALCLHPRVLRKRHQQLTNPIGLPPGQRPDPPSPYKRRGLRSKYIILGVYITLTTIVYLAIMFSIAIG